MFFVYIWFKSKTKHFMKSKGKNKDIDRKEALQKLGNYGKYAALTAIGTFIMLSPKKAQASS